MRIPKHKALINKLLQNLELSNESDIWRFDKEISQISQPGQVVATSSNTLIFRKAQRGTVGKCCLLIKTPKTTFHLKLIIWRNTINDQLD